MSGSVTFDGVGLNLKAAWLDNKNLEVQYPKDVEFTRNTLDEVTHFLDSEVRIRLIPFE